MKIIITNDNRLEKTRQDSNQREDNASAPSWRTKHKGGGVGVGAQVRRKLPEPVAYSFTVSKRVDLIINFKVAVKIALLSS